MQKVQRDQHDQKRSVAHVPTSAGQTQADRDCRQVQPFHNACEGMHWCKDPRLMSAVPSKLGYDEALFACLVFRLLGRVMEIQPRPDEEGAEGPPKQCAFCKNRRHQVMRPEDSDSPDQQCLQANTVSMQRGMLLPCMPGRLNAECSGAECKSASPLPWRSILR